MIGLVDGNNFFVSCERVFNRRLVGRPVAVLSNNDGCCVARSNEFKALGISMGTPYFQLKHREKTGELFFCSSNYELYGDMSNRIISILREEAVDVEQYSIDESFLDMTGTQKLFGPPIEVAHKIKDRIYEELGFTVNVGISTNKLLAKMASDFKKPNLVP